MPISLQVHLGVVAFSDGAELSWCPLQSEVIREGIRVIETRL